MTTDRRINDRQLKAVLEAIAEHHSGGFTEALAIANTAIDASDAKHVPMLVEALKFYADIDAEITKMLTGFSATPDMRCKESVAEKALSQLPPELRGE